MTIRRICVNCGSSPGFDPCYMAMARELGRALVSSGHELVYGGADVGLMGELANAVLQAGGRVHGVIPESLAHKVSHQSLTELHVVGSMHERKALMSDMSDAFVALPGGYGTLEELAEVLTWAQLGLHENHWALAMQVVSQRGPCLHQVHHYIGSGWLAEGGKSLFEATRRILAFFDDSALALPPVLNIGGGAGVPLKADQEAFDYVSHFSASAMSMASGMTRAWS